MPSVWPWSPMVSSIFHQTRRTSTLKQILLIARKYKSWPSVHIEKGAHEGMGNANWQTNTSRIDTPTPTHYPANWPILPNLFPCFPWLLWENRGRTLNLSTQSFSSVSALASCRRPGGGALGGVLSSSFKSLLILAARQWWGAILCASNPHIRWINGSLWRCPVTERCMCA